MVAAESPTTGAMGGLFQGSNITRRRKETTSRKRQAKCGKAGGPTKREMSYRQKREETAFPSLPLFLSLWICACDPHLRQAFSHPTTWPCRLCSLSSTRCWLCSESSTHHTQARGGSSQWETFQAGSRPYADPRKLDRDNSGESAQTDREACRTKGDEEEMRKSGQVKRWGGQEHSEELERHPIHCSALLLQPKAQCVSYAGTPPNTHSLSTRVCKCGFDCGVCKQPIEGVVLTLCIAAHTQLSSLCLALLLSLLLSMCCSPPVTHTNASVVLASGNMIRGLGVVSESAKRGLRDEFGVGFSGSVDIPDV